MRREHPKRGPVRIAHELGRAGVMPVPSRMSVYRVLVRHGLIEPGPRKRPKDSYVRWERDEPMELWQMDIVGGPFLADGTEAKIVTGVDDHSRYCVIASAVTRATGRAVCLAFAAALREFGVPGEVLTDNGKQFTDRFGKGGEVLSGRICRDNGIIHRLTQPRTPTTTGKIERFHGSLRRELLDDAAPFPDLPAAQAALDEWVREYNTRRPHQAIGMKVPAGRFSISRARAEQELLPLRLPSVIALAPVPALPAEPPEPAREADGELTPADPPRPYDGRPGGVRPGGPGQREHAGRRAEDRPLPHPRRARRHRPRRRRDDHHRPARRGHQDRQADHHPGGPQHQGPPAPQGCPCFLGHL
jgi:transposase InsO family protein